jgi:hypothetical protein
MDYQQGRQTVQEAKAIVALAIRNGPIEDLHAGRSCPTCHGELGYSRLSQEDIRQIMKSAVNCVYRLLVLRGSDHDKYDKEIAFGLEYTTNWDDPEQP